MQTSVKPSRLSNLYKPLIILISTYALVNLTGFFVQHDFSKDQPAENMAENITKMDIQACEHLIIHEKIPSTPAPPRVYIKHEKKTLSSGETINLQLP